MTATDPRADWRQDVGEAGNNAWEVYRATHGLRDFPSDMMLELKEAYGAGWQSGVRWGVRSTTKLSPQINALVELLTWIAASEGVEAQS